ncbi:MAG: BON domain-containing protein [Alphaproteobacteria bacterium]
MEAKDFRQNKGGKKVTNETEVDFSLGYKLSAADVIAETLHVLQWEALVPHEHIEVIVEKGHLILTGEVEYAYQKECAQKIVENLYGVTFITTDIKVRSNDRPSGIEVELVKEPERNVHIDTKNIYVEVDGGTVTLKGNVRTSDEDREARITAWSVPGVDDVVDQLRIGL